MAEAKSDWKKLYSYWKKLLRKTFRETEIVSVIKEAIVGGVIPPFLGLLAKVVAKDEVKELIFLAVSGAAALILVPFIFRLVFVTPEKMLRESEKKSQSSGQQAQPITNILEPTQPGVFGLIILGAFCIGSVLILILQISRNSRLQEQIAELKIQTNSIPQRTTPKPVSIQTIPRPEPPPREPLQTAENKPAAVAQTNKPFENFEPATINPDFSEVLSNKWATQVREAAEAKKQHEQQVSDLWSNDVPHFRHALTSLRDSMLHLAEKDGDNISQSDGFLQCLPDKLDPNFGAFKPAEIRFQKNTNIDFMISVEAVNGDGNRGFIISCAAGFLHIGEGRGSWHCTVNIPSASFNEIVVTDANGADTNTISSLKELISAERYFLSHKDTK